MTGPVLSVRGLEVAFGGGDNPVPVVRGIDFDVYANEVLCIVGESGSGKSVTALAISGLLPATARVRGSIVLGGTEVIGADPEALRNMRERRSGSFSRTRPPPSIRSCRLGARSPRDRSLTAGLRQATHPSAQSRSCARSTSQIRLAGRSNIRTNSQAG